MAWWSEVRAWPETIVSHLPPAEHVTELRNVAVINGSVHLHIRADDTVSDTTIRDLGLSLPPQALAAGRLPFHVPLVVHRGSEGQDGTPLVCDRWLNVTAAYFVRVYHPANLCHLLNENLLPILYLMLVASNDHKPTVAAPPPPAGAGPGVYVFGASAEKELPHWKLTLSRAASAVGDAHDFFQVTSRRSATRGDTTLSREAAGRKVDHRRRHARDAAAPGFCVRRLVWGLGPKPFYTSFRVAETRAAVSALRAQLLAPPGSAAAAAAVVAAAAALPQPPGDGSTITIRRWRGTRSVSNFHVLERLMRIDAHCCDFRGMPLHRQLALLGNASVIVGLHGAGLANVVFARRGVVLVELKGSYGITDLVYRKYVQTVHGGWAIVHVAESEAGHFMTPSQAHVVAKCVTALRRGAERRCASLPHVMQVAAVGHEWDCWFREWHLGRQPACDTPSWVEATPAGCCEVHAHSVLTPLDPLPERRCAWRFDTLQAALEACAATRRGGAAAGINIPGAQSCAGVSRRFLVPPAQRRWVPKGLRVCAGRMYELGMLPREEYNGTASGEYTWVLVPDETHEACSYQHSVGLAIDWNGHEEEGMAARMRDKIGRLAGGIGQHGVAGLRAVT